MFYFLNKNMKTFTFLCDLSVLIGYPITTWNKLTPLHLVKGLKDKSLIYKIIHNWKNLRKKIL